MNLFMLIVGGKPKGRFTEQHDVYFGIAHELKDLVPAMLAFWPEMEGQMHIDSYRKVNNVQGCRVQVIPRDQKKQSNLKLFFVNLGGYKPNDMEEYHYKHLVLADSLVEASKMAKASLFYKHHDSAHIDDKYGLDVDDIYEVDDMLDPVWRNQFHLDFKLEDGLQEDGLEVGYLKLSKL